MIKINLLPVRVVDKSSGLKVQAGIGVGVLLVVIGVCFGFYNSKLTEIKLAQAQIRQVEDETKRLQSIIGEIEQIKSRKADLEKKLEVIDTLEKDRLNTVRVMEAIAKSTPDQLWLTSLDYVGGGVKLQGSATDNQIIAKLIQTLGQTPGVSGVVLSETKRGQEDGFDIVQFTLTFTIKPKSEANNGPSTQRKG